MNKKINIICIILCMIFIFLGCTTNKADQSKDEKITNESTADLDISDEALKDDTVEKETVGEEVETTEDEKLIVDGFSLTFVYNNNEDFYYELWYLDKKVANITDVFQKVVDTYVIWNVFDKDDKKYVFFETAAGCMGCIGLAENYLIFDPVDFSFEANQFENHENIALFDKEVVPTYSILSPDKTKIAYVSFDRKNLSLQNLNEQIKIFDLSSGEEQTVFEVPASETVLFYTKSFDTFSNLIDGTIKWDDDSKNVRVTTLKRPLNEDKTYGIIPYFEDYLLFSYDVRNIYLDGFENSKFESFPIDFEGDYISEYAIFYESYDNIGNDEYRNNQHLKIYKIIDGKWQTIKEDIAALDNVGVESEFSSIKVIDLGENGKQELMVTKDFGRKHRDHKYSVFALYESEYQDLAIPKGYLNSEKYLKDGEAWLNFRGPEADSTGITEVYDVFCEGAEVLPESDKVPCGEFSLFLKYENGEFYPEEIINE